jgi:polyisoprenoid-binding protein YceI
MKLAAAVAATAMLAAGVAAAQSYSLDPDHTYPHWSVNHLGLTTYQGKFTRSKGKAVLERGKGGAVEVEIDPTSSVSGSEVLDKVMKGEMFFQVDKFPAITFKSTALRWNGDRLVAVDGLLTMIGQTKPVTLDVKSLRCTTHFRTKKEVCGVEAFAILKRSDWGIAQKFQPPLLGDEVTLYVQSEGFID